MQLDVEPVRGAARELRDRIALLEAEDDELAWQAPCGRLGEGRDGAAQPIRALDKLEEIEYAAKDGTPPGRIGEPVWPAGPGRA